MQINIRPLCDRFVTIWSFFEEILTGISHIPFYIDECQALSSRAQHILLTAIAEKKLYLPRSASCKSKRKVPLANFVLILASAHESGGLVWEVASSD